MPVKPCGCGVTAIFESVDTVNIYGCWGPGRCEAEPAKPAAEGCPPPATGACIPLAPGAKHKQGMARKLDKLARNEVAPSVIAGAIMQQARRYIAGASAGNTLEASVFAVFDALPPRLHASLSCAVDMLGATPKADCDRVFDPHLLAIGDRALTPSDIAEPFIGELEAKLADAVFAHVDCVDERPGLPRPVFSTINGGAFLGFLPKIFRINGLTLPGPRGAQEADERRRRARRTACHHPDLDRSSVMFGSCTAVAGMAGRRGCSC
jgi:hypothetical protein